MVAGAAPSGIPLRSARSALLDGVDRLLVAADSDLGSAVADLAVGPALLRIVAGNETRGRTGTSGWLRWYRPVPTIGFSRRDTAAAGYALAVAVSALHGFEPAVRSPGGRAAAYHRSSLCFELVLPDSGDRNPVEQISALGELVAELLQAHGVDARVGEIPGEYCPGRFSVNAGGVAKIVGTAGRRVRGAILLGGSIIVADADPVRAVLTAAYPALGLPMDPKTVGAAVDFGCLTADAGVIGNALVEALRPAVEVVESRVPAQVTAALDSNSPTVLNG